MPEYPQTKIDLDKAMEVCAREPIHIPGSIQPIGCLIIYDFLKDQIVAISENIDHYFTGSAGDFLGQPLHNLLSEDACSKMKGMIGKHQDWENKESRQLCRITTDRAQELSVVVRCNATQLLLEFEPVEEEESFDIEKYTYNVQENLGWVFSPATVPNETVYDLCLEELKRITGFDRVMLYCFDENYNGEVIREVRGEMDSYLGLHFPASDIPRQARRLYLKNRVRCIPDVDYQPVPLLSSHDQEKQPIDLTFSGLRSVSPIHLQYLRNMGVSASMSVSVIVDGRLWGLITMHHHRPLMTSHDKRAIANYIGQLLSMYIGRQEREYGRGQRELLKDLVSDILTSMINNISHFYQVLHENKQKIVELCKADGLMLVHDQKIRVQEGEIPVSEENLEQFVVWLQEKVGESLFYQQNTLPDDEQSFVFLDTPVPGMLAVPLLGASDAYLIWFRREAIREVKWAGHPGKEVVKCRELGQYRLGPRKSFKIWTEIKRGSSKTWDTLDIDMACEVGKSLAMLQVRHLNQLSSASEKYLYKVREEYQHREAVHEVQLLNQQFKTFINSSPDALAVIDNDNRFLVLNARYQQMFRDRYGKVPRIGDSLMNLFKESPEKLRPLLKFWEQVRQEKVTEQDASYLDHHGNRRYISSTFNFVYGDSTNFIGILDTTRDNTDSKLASKEMNELLQKYALLVNSVAPIIWTTDGKGDFIKSQPEWERFTGQSYQEYQKRGWLDVLDSGDRANFEKQWENSLQKLEYFEQEIKIWDHENQNHHYFLACAIPITNDSEKVEEWFGICIDIQQIKEQELKLESALEALQTSNADLQHFAYVASHDLQEPLRMVSSYMELIEKKYNEKLDDKGRLYIYYAVDGARRMKQLIDDLLTYARINKSVGYSTVDLNDLIRQAFGYHKLKIEELNARIDAADLPVIQGIPVQLLQLFNNLIGNSLKFAREDVPPVIKIQAHERKLSWQIIYQDNGIGIGPQHAEKIFKIFYRANGKKKNPGTGIGLAICQRVVTNHGGKIWVDNQYQYGARFIFTLRKTPKNEST